MCETTSIFTVSFNSVSNNKQRMTLDSDQNIIIFHIVFIQFIFFYTSLNSFYTDIVPNIFPATPSSYYLRANDEA